MDLNPDQLIEMGKISETSLPARGFNALNKAILRIADDVVALDRFMADRLLRKRDVREKMSILPPWPIPTIWRVSRTTKTPSASSMASKVNSW